jgi:hypothetical protein
MINSQCLFVLIDAGKQQIAELKHTDAMKDYAKKAEVLRQQVEDKLKKLKDNVK